MRKTSMTPQMAYSRPRSNLFLFWTLWISLSLLQRRVIRSRQAVCMQQAVNCQCIVIHISVTIASRIWQKLVSSPSYQPCFLSITTCKQIDANSIKRYKRSVALIFVGSYLIVPLRIISETSEIKNVVEIVMHSRLTAIQMLTVTFSTRNRRSIS